MVVRVSPSLCHATSGKVSTHGADTHHRQRGQIRFISVEVQSPTVDDPHLAGSSRRIVVTVGAQQPCSKSADTYRGSQVTKRIEGRCCTSTSLVLPGVHDGFDTLLINLAVSAQPPASPCVRSSPRLANPMPSPKLWASTANDEREHVIDHVLIRVCITGAGGTVTTNAAQPERSKPMTEVQPHQSQTASDALARARNIAPLIESEAEFIERDATITQRVVDALVEQRLFWLLVPQEYGGCGLGMADSLKVVEEISRADGSTGWALMANAFSTGIAVGFLETEGAKEIFDRRTPGITAGMILPTGSAVRVDGGYRVTGRYQFASGSAHADWIGAGFTVQDAEGNPILTDTGDPVARVAFLPREKVDFLGNWNVMGMVGTGSYDYAVTDQFVPEKHTMDAFSTTPVRSEPVYKLGLLGIGVGGHSGVALGLATRALQEIVTVSSGKGRVGYSSVVGESEMFRREFGKYEALLQAARRYVYDIHREAEDTAAAGEEITLEQRSRMRQVTTWVQEVASEVVGFAHRWGGSQSIRNPSALGRCTRDAAVATQHLLVDPMTLVDAAQGILPGYLRAAG